MYLVVEGVLRGNAKPSADKDCGHCTSPFFFLFDVWLHLGTIYCPSQPNAEVAIICASTALNVGEHCLLYNIGQPLRRELWNSDVLLHPLSSEGKNKIPPCFIRVFTLYATDFDKKWRKKNYTVQHILASVHSFHQSLEFHFFFLHCQRNESEDRRLLPSSEIAFLYVQ